MVRLRAVLLGQDCEAKIGDVGLAKFMPQDYLSRSAICGTFAWSVRTNAHD